MRPKLSCARCSKVVQHAAPARPIERALPTAGLLAQVLVAKYADHCPLFRQSEIYARQGVAIERSTLAGWVEATGASFVFAVKANQRITHILRLKNAGQATEVFFNAIDPLRTSRRLGPVLFQLPPNLKCDAALLRDYLELLPQAMRYAFEFRHPSWLVEEVYGILRGRNISLCVAESERLEVPEVITADFVYYRLRKPSYTAEDIDTFAARAKDLLATGRDLYLMFKHEESPEGARHAESLLRKVRC